MTSDGMKVFGDKVLSAARLVRLPNVLIIILTQFLIRNAIISGLLGENGTQQLSGIADFILLVAATSLIAIGGYVINDYFDVRIDQVNKPGKNVIGSLISPRQAIALHILLNITGILIGCYLGYRVKSASFALLFPFISVLLWFYSTRYKRMLVTGNLVVSFLSAFVLIIVWLFEFLFLRLNPSVFADVMVDIPLVSRIVLGYSVFAFLVTLAREIVKDMEDLNGDREMHCRTLPVVAGIVVSKWIVTAVLLITLGLLVYGQVILSRLGYFMAIWYCLLTLTGPLLYFLFRLKKADNQNSFHYLGNLLKVIMLAGICSMQLISLNF